MISYSRKNSSLFAGTFTEWLAIRWPDLKPYKFQQQIIDLLDAYNGGVLPMMIVGASGGGKTTLINEFIVYVFLCFDKCRIRFISQTERQSTGNSFDGIKKIITDLCKKDDTFAKSIIFSDLRITHGRSNSYVEVRAVTTASGREGSLKGFHAPRGGMSLQVVDECDAMPQSVWNALSSNITNDNAIVACMSNGGDINSFAYKIWASADKFWKRIHFTAADIPTYNWDVANSRRMAEGGEAWYSRYVLAEWVSSGDSTLFPAPLLKRAMESEPVETDDSTIVCGLDIGGTTMQSNQAIATTAFAIRKGRRILLIETIQDNSLYAVINRIFAAFKKHDIDASAVDIYVDSVGTGMNYTGQILQEHGLRSVPFFGSASSILTNARNMRTEVYMLMQSWLINGGSLKGVPQMIIDQMRYIEYAHHDRTDNKVALKPKRTNLKGLEQASLDILDAISFTFASTNEGAIILDGYNQIKKKKKHGVTYDYIY